MQSGARCSAEISNWSYHESSMTACPEDSSQCIYMEAGEEAASRILASCLNTQANRTRRRLSNSFQALKQGDALTLRALNLTAELAGGNSEKSPMELFSGTWRLVYSSAFASGSLGGFRPGPQAALVPVTIGQVRLCSCDIPKCNPS